MEEGTVARFAEGQLGRLEGRLEGTQVYMASE